MTEENQPKLTAEQEAAAAEVDKIVEQVIEQANDLIPQLSFAGRRPERINHRERAVVVACTLKMLELVVAVEQRLGEQHERISAFVAWRKTDSSAIRRLEERLDELDRGTDLRLRKLEDGP